MQSRISISGLLEPFILRKALSTSADNSAMRRIPSGPVPSPPGTLYSSLLGPDKDDRDLSSALHTDTPCGQSQTLETLYGGQTGVWLHSKECCCTLARALWAPTGAPARLGHLLSSTSGSQLSRAQEASSLAGQHSLLLGRACLSQPFYHIPIALQPLISFQLLFL